MNSALPTPISAAGSESDVWSSDSLIDPSVSPSTSPQNLVIIDGGLEQISTLITRFNSSQVVVLDPPARWERTG